MRPRGGSLRSDGTFVRVYVCPLCGERELVVRKVVDAPVFDLRGVHASSR